MGLNKSIVHKSRLDNLVDIKFVLCKKSNKPNIPQKLDFIPAYELDQKLFPLLATKKSTTKAILVDKPERIVLSTKNPQCQIQNPNIVYKKVKSAQKMMHELKNKACSYSYFFFSVYCDNSIGLAISLFIII